MEKTKSLENLSEVLSFLQDVENGYKPSKEDLRVLSEITKLDGAVPEGLINLPKSVSLLYNLRELDISWSDIENIEAIANLSNLQKLDLSNTQVQDFSALSKLIKLKNLNLSDTKLRHIDFLSELTELKFLDISSTSISDVRVLSNHINLLELNLADTGITDTEGISNLPKLMLLDLSNTKVSSISGLEKLTALQDLDLSDTSVTDITPLSGIISLRELKLDGTPLSDIKPLYRLINLERLHLGGTRITDVNALSNMSKLHTLNLNRATVSNIEGISKLTCLRELFLGGTRITNVDSLSKLTNLEGLALWRTPISSADKLSKLTNLKTLAIQWTRITNIGCLSPLRKLEKVYLSGAPISVLPHWLCILTSLKKLDISNMHLHSIPSGLVRPEFLFTNKESRNGQYEIVMANTTLATQPISLFEQPRELIEAYYKSKHVPINEAKVIFLGDGGAGKTHTIQRIRNNGICDKYETETTPGIEITNYTVKKDDRQFNIHFWDFGGQEIMHAMHRCFLTDRTCYVVVVSNRWDLNARARYWLKNIDSFAKGAPVILAINQWDNIQETGIDMNRLLLDYPNLIKQPVYYSAKNSSQSEFQQLIDSIIREAGKLDSTAMSFPVQWASIRQHLLDIAEVQYYIDKEEYHRLCDQQKLNSPQIRTWLLEWFNDLGVCFSYHQEGSEKSELASYKVLNPRWLTNAIYIIINAGIRYADKGRMKLTLIQDLLGHPEFGVLSSVTYSESERDYVLDVMRKFNLSYSVSQDLEFIPALCDSETPCELHPNTFITRISYKLEYSYLPDSVVHQLMIRSYKNLNPDKVWRKGLRIDIEWLGLTAVVDMGNDDSTLCVDVYSNSTIEPWALLHSIRNDLSEINANLGLKAKDYIIVHTGDGTIEVMVNQLLDAKEQGMSSIPLYNESARKWEYHKVDELLGCTFGEEVIAATMKKAKEKEQTVAEAFASVKIENVYICQQSPQPDAFKIIDYLIQNQCETNTKILDCLVAAFESTNNTEAQNLARDIKQDHKERKNFLERIANYIKPAATIITSGKTVYEGGKAVINAIQTAYPVIQEKLPEIAEFLQNIQP